MKTNLTNCRSERVTIRQAAREIVEAFGGQVCSMELDEMMESASISGTITNDDSTRLYRLIQTARIKVILQ